MRVAATFLVSPLTLGTSISPSATGGLIGASAPEEITRLTVVPGATCDPAAGFWPITLPAGTAELVARVKLPTFRHSLLELQAPSTAVRADVTGEPVTAGTVIGLKPADTTILTSVPGATLIPPTGLWLITCPAGIVVLAAVVTVAARVAFWIAAMAALCVRPTTFGTVAVKAEPVDTTILTVLPGLTLLPATGSWLITWPAGTVRLASVDTVKIRLAFWIAVMAALCVWPTTFGTVEVGVGPVDTTKLTGLPIATFRPPAGL